MVSEIRAFISSIFLFLFIFSTSSHVAISFVSCPLCPRGTAVTLCSLSVPLLVLVTCFPCGALPPASSRQFNNSPFLCCICVSLFPFFFPYLLPFCLKISSSPLHAPCVFCSLPFLSLVFLWDHSGSCLLFLFIASTLGIGFVDLLFCALSPSTAGVLGLLLFISALLLDIKTRCL